MPDVSISEFFLGGVAACGACLFSNPLEVVKTRMQLQGELKARGSYHRHYRNVFHAFFTIGRVDGLLALQKGLGPALWYQLFMNGCRLGSYQCFFDLGLTKNSKGEVSVLRSVPAGALAGATGALVSSPFYMIKTHLQAQSHQVIAVGYQHTHTGMTMALRQTFRERGFFGLWRGATAAVVRVSFGSAAQLSTFSTAKEMVINTEFFKPQSIAIPFCASMVSGVAVVCIMTPFDVISTRLYNQGLDPHGKGLYYSGFMDCLWKILRNEGLLGFYKGWSASWFRTAPHTVLSLLFWDEGRKLYKKLKGAK
ncbi:solute carrier family 25 member 35-like [Asterias rubens]|uniref:solute carrier family 25 member 35-like n=1 Tax=Asterias rubens TaxID=7604 RepID=UPI0014554761|nr:solute carrier family 25 member 35-like [Asterias rubens]XP_033642676.1 solute carrier family 25 member 35-like [Asterias rubens]